MSRHLALCALVAAVACSKNPPAEVGKACVKNADCPSVQCLPLSDGRNVCSVGCDSAAACPLGWTCKPLPSGGTPLCQCDPSPEVCDGIDNDCDGVIDNNCGGIITPGADLAVAPPAAVQNIDILIMMDDSPSISPVIQELSARVGDLFKTLDDTAAAGHPASYHIGVITSDLGAAQSLSAANCKPGGLGGVLQTPSTSRGHAPACATQQLGGGVNFIEYDQTNNTNNLPLGVSLPEVLGCMTAVGDTGCGFEMPLEAVYQALSGTVAQNHDFLRPDAALAVLWVTNEDDCSAPPNTDLFDLNQTATYGAELSYRCTNYGIMCGVPPMLPPYAASGSALAECQGATTAVGGKLYEMSRYIDFFQHLKSNPRLVVLGAIAAPPTPFATVVGNPNSTNYQPCAAGTTVGTAQCAVLLQHSCMASTQVFGDPAVRIDQLLRSMPTFVEGSVCSADYTATIESFAAAIAQLQTGM